MNVSSKQAGEMPAAVPRNSTYVGGNCPISPGQQQKDQNRPSSFNKKMVRYKECLKNHAAAIGGNATDGCGEFMPSGEEGTLEGLNCSACNCHRNFHRKETESSSNDQFYHMQYPPLLNNIGGRNQVILGSSHHKELLGYPAGTLIRAAPAPQQNTIMSYKSTTGSLPNSESDEQDHGGGLGGVVMGRPAVKKRFRTKFTQEQKEKMLRFAEKAEWRIQKVEESVVQQFCQELGIKRRVLKVWMHNNKHNLAEKNSSSAC